MYSLDALWRAYMEKDQLIGEGVGFARTVRITGYTTTVIQSKTGTSQNRLNDAKRDEIFGTHKRTVNSLRCEECSAIHAA